MKTVIIKKRRIIIRKITKTFPQQINILLIETSKVEYYIKNFTRQYTQGWHNLSNSKYTIA